MKVMNDDERARVILLYRLAHWVRWVRKTQPKMTAFEKRCIKIAIQKGLHDGRDV